MTTGGGAASAEDTSAAEAAAGEGAAALGGVSGELFLLAHWLAVPKAVRARRVNRSEGWRRRGAGRGGVRGGDRRQRGFGAQPSGADGAGVLIDVFNWCSMTGVRPLRGVGVGPCLGVRPLVWCGHFTEISLRPHIFAIESAASTQKCRISVICSVSGSSNPTCHAVCAPNPQDVDAAIQLYFQEQQLSSSSDEEADGAADTAAEVRYQ
jgi:hypothetical protein